jgi:hypothetical protein
MQLVNKNRYLFLLWLSLTSTAPFIFFSWPGHPYKVLTFFCLAIMLMLILKKYQEKIFDFKIFGVLGIQAAFYLFAAFYHKDLSNFALIIQLFSLFITITFITGYIGFKLFVKSYIYALLFMAIGGTITFFIHLLIGIAPIFTVDYSASGTSYFLGLTSTNVYYDIGSIRLIRYSGFFDEPGAFALYSLFAIILNRVYFENKRIEIWLMVLTMFTLSLSFYVIVFFYFLFFYLSRSNVKYFIFVVALVIGSYFYLEANKTDESLKFLYDFTFKRFELDDSGSGLADNNREELSNNDKQIFLSHPFLGVGLNSEVSGSNFYSIFARYGIIGSLFYYALLVYLIFLIIQLKREKLIFYLKILFLILINFYHRPEMSALFTLVFFVALIVYVRTELEEQELEYEQQMLI